MNVQEMVTQGRDAAIGYAMKFFGNIHDAEEAYQEACIKALTSYNPNRTYVGGWFMEITKNVCYDLKRRSKARPVARLPEKDALENLIVARDEDPAVAEERQAKADQVKQLFRKLTADERTILTMKYADRLSHQDIARKLNISEVNARQRVFRAMTNLRAAAGIQ